MSFDEKLPPVTEEDLQRVRAEYPPELRAKLDAIMEEGQRVDRTGLLRSMMPCSATLGNHSNHAGPVAAASAAPTGGQSAPKNLN